MEKDVNSSVQEVKGKDLYMNKAIKLMKRFKVNQVWHCEDTDAWFTVYEIAKTYGSIQNKKLKLYKND